MIPKSLSATAIQVAEACPARFKAEHLLRSKGFGGVAANTGSTVHGALEYFVKAVYIDKTEQPTFDLLIEFLKLSYVEVFGTHDTGTPEYNDAWEMLEKWFKRNRLDEIHRVVSAEVKENFELPTSAGPITFNYIWDRFDEIKPGVFKVVDYKSNRWNITSEDLQKKIQPRAYALAAAIKLKAMGIPYTKIWVEFDMLRHTPVGRVFKHEDNLATWNFLIQTAEDIIARDEDDFEERLNPECIFCVRKVECDTLKKNIMVGGIHSIETIEQAVDMRAQADWQARALNAVITELDTRISTEAKHRDLEELETQDNRMYFSVSSQRTVDAEMVEKVIGEDLFEKYGKSAITMGNVDKLLKGKEITAEQKKVLGSLIYKTFGSPRVKVVPRNPIDD